jgi:chaperonin GroES|tara:strand:+ start:14379 stop:14675 length:297 start_codon:yes stop_codon:yes gene_type:complete
MIRPIEYNVLIRPDPAEQKTKGGIILSDQTVETDKHAQQRGVIVSMSPASFDYAEWPEGAKPQIGDRVIFARYDGILWKEGEDEFRLVKDKAIAAVIE